MVNDGNPIPEPGVLFAFVAMFIYAFFFFFYRADQPLIGRLMVIATAVMGFWLFYARFRWRGWLMRWKKV